MWWHGGHGTALGNHDGDHHCLEHSDRWSCGGMVVTERLLAPMMVFTTVSGNQASGHVVAWWSLNGSWQS